MTKQEFIQLKISEAHNDIIDAIEYMTRTQLGPRVEANYRKFIQIAQGNIDRYQRDDLNEGELYRLEIENSTQHIADEKLFELHNS